MSTHTHFEVGKRLHVILKDGTAFVDRYVARHSRSVEFRERGRVDTREIRSITYIRGARGRAAEVTA